MKFHIDIDCTPDEARRFLGLSDVAPMQQRVLEAMERRLVESIEATDTATLVERWIPVGLQGIEQWQAAWSQLAAAATGAPRKSRSKSD